MESNLSYITTIMLAYVVSDAYAKSKDAESKAYGYMARLGLPLSIICTCAAIWLGEQ